MNRTLHAVLGLTFVALLELGCPPSGGGGSGGKPVITEQPASQTVNLGATAKFSVKATGDSLTYQWQRGGTDITGATASVYTSLPATAPDSGAKFRVVVKNAQGSVTSDEATLGVSTLPTHTLTLKLNDLLRRPISGPLAYHDGDGAWQLAPSADENGVLNLPIGDAQGRYGIATAKTLHVQSSTRVVGAMLESTLGEASSLNLTVYEPDALPQGTLSFKFAEGLAPGYALETFCGFAGGASSIPLGATVEIQAPVGSYDCLGSTGDQEVKAHYLVKRSEGVPGSQSYSFGDDFEIDTQTVDVHADAGTVINYMGGGIVLASSELADYPLPFGGVKSIPVDDATGTYHGPATMVPHASRFHGHTGLDVFTVSDTLNRTVETFFEPGTPVDVTLPPPWGLRSVSITSAPSAGRPVLTYDEIPELPVRRFQMEAGTSASAPASWQIVVTAGFTASQTGATRTWIFPDLSGVGGFGAQVPGTSGSLLLGPVDAAHAADIPRLLELYLHAQKYVAGDGIYTSAGFGVMCNAGTCE